MTELSIVVPCFNEEEVLPETIKTLTALLDKLRNAGKVNDQSRIYFVDDGSTDRTWELIAKHAGVNEQIGGIKLTRNCGHQAALLAGLMAAPGEAIVSIDADLQDNPDVIEEMLDHFCKGAQIVYGVRKRRDQDTVFKRVTAEGYYRMLRVMGVDVVFNHADYRLMGRQAINALKEYSESNLFLRGIVPTIGFSSATVEYGREARMAGESKYPLGKMLALAVDGITSFSAAPLRYIALLGTLIFAATLILSVWVLWVRLFSGGAVPGWASLVLPMYFLGGVQLLSIGIVGEYVAKIYIEVKRRPRYFIECMV